MPVVSSHTWQLLLPFASHDDEPPATDVAPWPEADNSAFNEIEDPTARAHAIARALTAGVEGADPKSLAGFVLSGIRRDDV